MSWLMGCGRDLIRGFSRPKLGLIMITATFDRKVSFAIFISVFERILSLFAMS